MHCIYNDVPAKIVMTPPTHNMTAKIEELSCYNETVSECHEEYFNYYEYASSVLTRSDLVLEYLDNSIIKMNESKSPTMQCKVGKEIDLFSGGVENYLKFRSKMLEEGAKGIERAINVNVLEEEFDAMIVD